MADNLIETRKALKKLFDVTSDVEQKKQLYAQLTALLDAIDNKVEENVKAKSTDYAKLTASLNETNAAIQQALKDLSKTASTIRKVAKLVELFGKLAAKIP